MSQRKWTPKEKLEIVLEGLREGHQVADVCRRRGISTAIPHSAGEQADGVCRNGVSAEGRQERPTDAAVAGAAFSERSDDRGNHRGEPGSKKNVRAIEDHPHVPMELRSVIVEEAERMKRRSACPPPGVERAHRTLGEALDEFEVQTYWEANDRIAEIVEWHNHRRFHSGINYLRPIDYYRGGPERLLRIRQRKIERARHRRKEENLKRKQRTLFFSFPQQPELLISATCEKPSFL